MRKFLSYSLIVVAVCGLVWVLSVALGGELPTRDMDTQLQEVYGKISADANFTIVATNASADINEATATAFDSGTGKVQINIHYDSGAGATAGTITIYCKALAADTVYTAMPGATYPLVIGTTSRISPVINLGGPGSYKLVVSAFAGTMQFDLGVRDCHR